MALEIIRSAPQLEDYTPLSEHQAQTPGTFFGGKPVLYYHTTNADLSLETAYLTLSPSFSVLSPATANTTNGNAANGDSNSNQTVIPRLDIYVTSEHLIIFSPAASAGVQIPYPTISLHAQQSLSLYMQLCLSDLSQTADEDLETVELLVTPREPEPASVDSAERSEEQRVGGSVLALYAAVSACADLHPDPVSDEEGGAQEEQMQMQMPGPGGWITSENMHDFMDEEGNFRVPEGLGAGAGSVRTLEEARFEDAEGDDGADDELKWRRTE
ncbi:regulator of volume decrease after cellular swelling-domain-containing protein [Delphinella strobiligena]|nr:regulator of volume decrease after cellular swelling-domain-containing protein [Delphinella strobiligena]